MQSKAKTVAKYLAELPPDRRAAISAVRAVIIKNLDKGFEEVMSYGMIGYVVPHKLYPAGYHCDPKLPLPYAGLASQKNHMSLYLTCCYGDGKRESWLREEFAKAGKKLDMGKSCIRFKKLEDLPLAVIGKAIKNAPLKQYVAMYQELLAKPSKGPKKKATVRRKTARASAA
jgi:uncharacterized protein YdhG (YjbR/CyaY superfamily)